jgi:iron complex transport system substrate-binding protein
MKYLLSFLFALVLSFGFAQDFPVTVTDGIGQTLTFTEPPQRVVSLYHHGFGFMATLEVRPVATAADEDQLNDPRFFNGRAQDIPKINTTDGGYDLEQIASLDPDLILSWDTEQLSALQGIAPVLVYYPDDDLENIYQTTRVLAEVLAETSKAEEEIQDLEDRLAAYQKLAPRDITVLKLGVLGDKNYMVSTTYDPICQLLDLVAVCEWPDPTGAVGTWNYETTLEGVLALDPDVILPLNWASEDAGELQTILGADPLWNEVRAVQDGRVIQVEGYTNPVASSIPAAEKFLDTFMPVLYPDVFPEPLTDEQVQDILNQ